jgi:hypothetical protein
MKKTLLLFVFFPIIAFYACENNIDSNLISFELTKNTSFQEIDIVDVLELPFEVVINKEFIVVGDIKSEWFFHFFSKAEKTYLGSIFRRGRGPNEEIMIFPFFRFVGVDSILFQNHNSIKIGRIVATQSGLENSIVFQYDLPEEMRMDSDFFIINNVLLSSFASRPVTKDFQAISTINGKIFEAGNIVPEISSKLENEDFSYIHSGKLTTVKPDKTRFASVFGSFPIIRIYDSTNITLVTEVQVNSFSTYDLGLNSYYWRVRSTNKYIFALYYGDEIIESEVFNNEMPKYFDYASIIHVFDWDGNPIMKLELDRPIFSFDVTPDNKQIIAISITDPDHLLVAEIPWD